MKTLTSTAIVFPYRDGFGTKKKPEKVDMPLSKEIKSGITNPGIFESEENYLFKKN